MTASANGLVLAQVLGIHFGRTRKEETEKILEGLKRREPEARSVSYNSVAKLAMKPYPDIQAVANAYRLCCMKAPEAKELSPMSMWDLHFLRQLDNSGIYRSSFMSEVNDDACTCAQIDIASFRASSPSTGEN